MTGHSDAEQAAISIVNRPGAQTEWCVIKLGPQGALIRTKHPPQTLRQSALQVSINPMCRAIRVQEESETCKKLARESLQY